MEIVTTEIRKMIKFENLKESIEFLKNYKKNKEIEFIFYEFDEYYATYKNSYISIEIKNVKKIKKMLSTFEHFRAKIPKNIILIIYNEEIVIRDDDIIIKNGDILEVTKVNLSNKNIKELENYFEKNNKKIKKMKIRSWNRKYFFIE